MGRRPQTPGAIPHLRARKKGKKTFYYYDHGGKPRKEEPLGSNYGLAVKRWAEIQHAGAEKPQEVITFRYVANCYRAEVIPTKGAGTQKVNLRELTKLIEFFDDPPGPLDKIEPTHVKAYLKWRGKTGRIRANREKALLSHIWNWAREEGYTSLPNPCAGVKGFKEKGRDVYVEDEVYAAVWEVASQPLKDAMDLAYLTGQRVGDTLRMDERDIRNGLLHVRQAKTGARVPIEVIGELAVLLTRIAKRKAGLVVRATRLIVGDTGQPLTASMLRGAFDRAREAAQVPKGAFQFRDLRAKAGTDKADTAGDIREAQKQLGHSSVVMTEHYTRNRRGAKVTPTK
jgi:integrase